MADQSLNAKLVRVQFQQGKTGLVLATSPDLKGLVMGKASFDELIAAVPEVIRDLYEGYGERMIVTAIGSESAEERCWVAIPESVALAELREAALSH